MMGLYWTLEGKVQREIQNGQGSAEGLHVFEDVYCRYFRGLHHPLQELFRTEPPTTTRETDAIEFEREVNRLSFS